jgi:hypothetical protein
VLTRCAALTPSTHSKYREALGQARPHKKGGQSRLQRDWPCPRRQHPNVKGEISMPKISVFVVLELFVINLLYAADCVHWAVGAQGLALCALALVNTGEFAIAAWVLVLAAVLTFLTFRAVVHAWHYTHHEITKLKEKANAPKELPPVNSETLLPS